MLSKQQLTQFEEEGYLLLSGLIPQETVTKAEAAMWQMMGMEADDPNSWGHFKRQPLAGFYMEQLSNGNRIELFGVTHLDVLACCTPDYLTVLNQLASQYPEIPHCKDHRPLMVSGHSISSPFQLNGRSHRHIWMATSEISGWTPGTFRATSLTYLTDVNSHGRNHSDMAPKVHDGFVNSAKRIPNSPTMSAMSAPYFQRWI